MTDGGAHGDGGCSTRLGARALEPFADVHLFCTLATLAVATAGLWLVLEEKA